MSSQVELVSIVTPLPRKIDQVVEELSVLTKYVEEHEPDVLRYQLYKQINPADGVECLVFIEVFKNKEALEAHRKSDTYKMIQKRGSELQLLAAPPDIKILGLIGGFPSR